MKRLLLPLLATLPLATAVEANLFQKEPTYKQIVSQCKRPGLKYAEYNEIGICLLYTSPSPRDLSTSRMPSSA